jgi:hypothetical protein
MSAPQPDPNRKWVRLSNPVTPTVLEFGAPPPDENTPHTELVVQLTIAAEAHQDDVAVVMEKLQAAIKDATAATGGRIDIILALPEIVKTR